MAADYPFIPPGTYTSWQILLHVAYTIESEPERLDMSDWVSMVDGAPLNLRYSQPSIYARGHRLRRPACGTVACVAGHIGLVTRGTGANHTSGFAAFRRLGLDTSQFCSVRGSIPAARTAVNDLNRLFFSYDFTAAQVVAELREICRRYRASLHRKTVVIS